jgi:hypothetical protein
LVRKTELIRTQLGSAGQVIGHRLSDRLEREGITRARSLATEIDEAGDEDLQNTAVVEMDDETEARRARQAKEIDDLREALERSREKVGVDPDELAGGFRFGAAQSGLSVSLQFGSPSTVRNTSPVCRNNQRKFPCPGGS